MNKLFAAAIFLATIMPMTARAESTRPGDGSAPSLNENWVSKPNQCLGSDGLPYNCRADVKHKAKKKHDTGTVVMITVATTAVFAGAMYYFFKKRPSENNPGQVKLAEF